MRFGQMINLFALIESIWVGEDNRKATLKGASRKPVAQYVEALWADERDGFQPTFMN